MNTEELTEDQNETELYVAISPEGFCYGRGKNEEEAVDQAVENWKSKWGGDAEPIPEFTVKVDDGFGYDE